MNERDLFIGALQAGDAAARQAYLQAACGGDVALRARVEGLLELHEQAGNFLEAPVVGPTPTSDEGDPQAPFSGEAPPTQAPRPAALPGLETAGSILESIVPDGVATVPESVRERPGRVVGPYRLLEQIGEGGFGIVFM